MIYQKIKDKKKFLQYYHKHKFEIMHNEGILRPIINCFFYCYPKKLISEISYFLFFV